MALNGLICADVPLSNYSLTQLCILASDKEVQSFEIGSGDPRHVGGYAAVSTVLMNV